MSNLDRLFFLSDRLALLETERGHISRVIHQIIQEELHTVDVDQAGLPRADISAILADIATKKNRDITAAGCFVAYIDYVFAVIFVFLFQPQVERNHMLSYYIDWAAKASRNSMLLAYSVRISPLHFFTLLDRTFANSTVFSVCHPQPLDELLSELKRAVPTTLRKTYAWGFNWKRTIPYAYILSKESKLWQAARPIVSYSDTWCTPLTSALALAIFEIMRHTLPAHLVTTDTKLILKTLHSNLTKAPHVWGLQFRQQDISGFFNSVEHDRIIFCIERLLQRFTQQQRLPADYHFGVQVQQKHRLSRVFTRGGVTTVRQVRGASMGNPCAPALCGAVAALWEVSFYEHCCIRQPQVSVVTDLRYVDNRFVHYIAGDEFPWPWRFFFHPFFYRPPLLLDHVDYEDVMGFRINHSNHSMIMKVPTETDFEEFHIYDDNGIWLLKDDALIGRTYNFLGRTCCGPCTEQCQGGLTCLMPFILCNLLTVTLSLILNNDIGMMIALFKNMQNAVTFYDAFVYLLWLVSALGAILAQVLGSIYGYLAYREIRDSGVTSSGGDWGGGYPQAREEAREARPAAPASNFQAFAGSGQRLGS
ncbi:unnamed protein product [Effrenium voratum]|nr:unnamed protein product [Effrenium voratum]